MTTKHKPSFIESIAEKLGLIENLHLYEYAAKEGIKEEKALAVGMAERAKGFVAMGGEIYQGNIPEGAKEHH
jgi:hypothetical protein